MYVNAIRLAGFARGTYVSERASHTVCFTGMSEAHSMRSRLRACSLVVVRMIPSTHSYGWTHAYRIDLLILA